MRRAAAALLAVLALAGCSTGTDAVARGTSFQFVAPGGQVDIAYPLAERQVAPVISGEDLMNPGRQLSTQDFAGRVVVLNLWGQWCPPCRAESAEIEQVYRQSKDSGVVVLGLDLRDDDRDAPQDFVRDRGLSYPSIYDPPGRTLLGLNGYPRNAIPSTIVLDKQHRVAQVFLRDLLATDLLPVVQRLTTEPA